MYRRGDPDPDMTITARETPIPMALLATVRYLDEPSGMLAMGREDACECVMCGVYGPACSCRFCPGCSRFWRADRAADRDDTPPVRRYGISDETCALCVDGGAQ